MLYSMLIESHLDEPRVIIADEEREYNFALKTIETATIKCINDSKCEMGKITIGQLQKEEYLEEIINPNTGEAFSEDSYMVYPDLSFYEV